MHVRWVAGGALTGAVVLACLYLLLVDWSVLVLADVTPAESFD